MSQLIYHPLPAVSRTSPFDECAIRVAQSGAIRIVSPYIGVGYLERLTALSPEWHLISDVEAWLGSLSFRARPRAWGFIRANLERIHHCPDIHAQVILGPSLAMMGSANLTHTGILGRTEMGILLDDRQMVDELQAWFSALWLQTASPTADEASALVQWLDDESSRPQIRRQRAALSSTAKKVRASLAQLPSETRTVSTSAPLSLVAVAKTLIAEETKHYDSLEQALTAMFGALAERSFTLGEAVRYVRSGFPGALVHEVYFGVIRYTANHVRSVFSEDTQNRLIIDNGRFSQSTRETLPRALARFDQFLFRLITEHFDFDVGMDSPSESQLEAETGFSGREQVLLFSELLDCGLLILVDIPGSLPMYRLDRSFEGWEGRFKFFPDAAHAWMALTRRSRDNKVAPPVDEIEPAEARYSTLPDLFGRQGDFDTPDELEERRLDRLLHADSLRQARAERALYDLVMAELVRRVLAGQKLEVDPKLVTAKQFSDLLGVPKAMIQSVLKGENRVGPRIFARVRLSASDDRQPVTLNPDVTFDSLDQFPRTRKVCEDFLGAESSNQSREFS